tara:strand:- start:2631 stop:2774 length:144 start_codon:yes stop_codon:yes gene_type:complete
MALPQIIEAKDKNLLFKITEQSRDMLAIAEMVLQVTIKKMLALLSFY